MHMSEEQTLAFNQLPHTYCNDGLHSFQPGGTGGIIVCTSCSKSDLAPSAATTPLANPYEDDDAYMSVEENGYHLLTFESDHEMVKQEGDFDIPQEHLHSRTLYALEMIALSFLQQVSSAQIELTLANRSKGPRESGCFSQRLMRWPKRKKEGSVRRFACLFRVIDLICEALTLDIPTTKREIFYRDVSLFKNQAVVDDLVDDLAATVGVTRADLNVRAAAKGLFCGSGLKIHLRRGGIIHGNSVEGALIPTGADISRLEVEDPVSWVLVVEKETVFQTLCRLNFSSNTLCPGPGIIITGKGYPDLATRKLVSQLSRLLPASIPILALVDADAHGLEILSVYKYGSQKLSHEGPDTAAPRLEWIGVHSSELTKLGIDRDKLIPLTRHDHKKALDMLRRGDAIMPARWREELSHMLHSRRKAEIEIITSAWNAMTQGHEQAFFRDVFQYDANFKQEPPLVRYLISKLHFWDKMLLEEHP